MAYKHINKKGTDYYLHRKEIKLRGSGKMQKIYYFAKDERTEAIDDLPDGFIVVENPKTGLPTLKKK